MDQIGAKLFVSSKVISKASSVTQYLEGRVLTPKRLTLERVQHTGALVSCPSANDLGHQLHWEEHLEVVVLQDRNLPVLRRFSHSRSIQRIRCVRDS